MTTDTDIFDDESDRLEKIEGWQDRIKERLVALGMNQETLANKIGVTRSAITHYLAGRRAPSLGQFVKIAKALEVNPGWLQYGPSHEIPTSKISTFLSALHPVPILTWEQAVTFEGLNQMDLSKVDEWVPNYYMQATNSYGLKIKGDAMTAPSGQGKSFHEGDIIVVDYGVIAKPGDFVIAHLTGTQEVTFKQYVFDAGIRYLKPLNPQYPTIKIDDQIHLLAALSFSITPNTLTG
jgi:SOS-response transcriptional repressor LexA